MDVHVQRHPLDLSGQSPLNLVEDEKHTLVGGDQRFFSPNGGAFYSDSVRILDVINAKTLTKDQYRPALYFAEPSERSNSAVYAGIVITDEDVSNKLMVSYQVVGGDYSSIAPAIIDAMDELQLNNREVKWGRLLGRPEFLPPADHLQDIADIYGFEYIVHLMEKIHMAMLVGDGASHDEIFAMLENRLDKLNDYYDVVLANLKEHKDDHNDPHDVTKTQIKLEKVDNFAEATNSDMDVDGVTEKFVTPARMHYLFTQSWVPEYDAHLEDYTNPHNVTKAQIGLGEVNNYPMASSALTITGENDFTYVHPLGMRYAISKQGGDLVNLHIDDKENPHNVTKAQVGLGSVSNQPLATIDEAKLGISTSYITPETLKVTIDTLVGDALSIHTSDYNNPHQVTKAQVGLSKVDNVSLSEMDSAFESATGMSSINLDGKIKYYQAQEIDLEITNYHVGSSYDVETPIGPIGVRGSQLEGKITKNSPLGDQPLTVSQDGKERTVNLHIMFSGVKQPTITGPAVTGNMPRVPLKFKSTSSPFGVRPWDSFDSHRHSVWQISTDENFNSLLVDKLSKSDLTAFTFSNMPQDTPLWIRVKHAGYKVTESPWSEPYAIHTQRNPKPSVSATGREVDGRITRKFTMVGSSFAGDGNHTKTQWRVRDASGNIVWDNVQSAADTSHNPYNNGFRPDSDAGLQLQVRYYSDTADWSPWSNRYQLNVMRRRVTQWTTSKDVSRLTERISSFTTKFETSRVTQVYMERNTAWTTSRQTTKSNSWTTNWVTTWTTDWTASKTTSRTTFFNRSTNYGSTTSYTTNWTTNKSTSRSTSRRKVRSTQYVSSYMQYTYSSRTTDTVRTTSRDTSSGGGGVIGGGCISLDTPLTRSDGSTMEGRDVKVGDVIRAAVVDGMIDESIDDWRSWTTQDISTAKRVDVTVKHVDRSWFRAGYRINDSLTITKEHEILANKGQGWTWYDARDLEVGDIVLDDQLDEILIESLIYVTGEFDVVDLDVEEVDTYFAGGLLVHNMRRIPRPKY